MRGGLFLLYAPLPCRYGAQHPIVVHSESNESNTKNYVVVGHCCESGDLFSCAPGDPEVLLPRLLKSCRIGDLVSIEGSGAYCAGMSTKNYNSFPEAAEVILDLNDKPHLIRRCVMKCIAVNTSLFVSHGLCFCYRRQTLEHMLENEVPYTP